MSIADEYLDKYRVRAAADMLRAYRDMEWKAAYGMDKVRQIQSSLESLPATLGKTPVSGGGGNKAEEALIAGIARKDAAERGYREAVEFMEIVTACLNRLSATERRLLELRYIDHSEGGGIARIMEELHVEKSEAYDRSKEALKRFTTLIY